MVDSIWWRLLRRLGQALLVVFGVVCLTFLIVRVVPGDPALAYAGPRASQEQLAQVRAQLGVDDPLIVQLFRYLIDLLGGDLGTSLRTRQPVAQDLMTALPASLQLTGAAILLAVAIGVPLGILAARYRARGIDWGVRVLSVLLVSLPVFWVAVMLQLYFSTKLGWLPTAGAFDPGLKQSSPLTTIIGMTVIDSLLTGNWAMLGSGLRHLILPMVVIAAYPTGLIAQMTRASVSDELQLPHVVYSRAAGFSERSIFTSLALRPALNPVISAIALVFAYSLVNSFLVEGIFNWPGLGSYTFAAIRAVDVPAVAGVTLVIAILYVVLNFLVDIVQSLIDPRVSSM